ncbi:MAG: YggT family protein [Candidatus Margulisiibacteriota bacterium]
MIRVVLSWIPHNRYNPVTEFIETVTEPLLSPFRNIIRPEKVGGLDLSPIFAFIALNLLETLIYRLL